MSYCRELQLPHRRKVLASISRASEYRILILGGSLPAGVDCNDGQSTFKQCSYPGKLEKWLLHRFPHVKLIVDNQASGGTPISAAIPSLSFWLRSKPDLILIDYSVNDAYEMQTFRGMPVMYLYESFIQQVRRQSPSSHMYFIVSCADRYCLHIHDIISFTAKVHQGGVISYYNVANCAALIERPYFDTENALPTYWDRTYHPTWKIHQLLADTVAAAIFRNESRASCIDNLSVAPEKVDSIIISYFSRAY